MLRRYRTPTVTEKPKEDTMLREMLRQKGAAKRDPEFHETQTELAHKLQWATMMREAGRLTKSEFQEFESHLTAEYLAALPVEAFVAMQKDGSYAELETIASHDGKRDRHDVLKDRKKLNDRITQDALDEAWAAQLIDSKMYAEEHKKLGTFDEDRVRRINDADDNGDGDAVSLDIFFERNLPPEPEPEPGNVPRLPESIASPPAPVEDRIKSADEE
jgi:hypothetical protein